MKTNKLFLLFLLLLTQNVESVNTEDKIRSLESKVQILEEKDALKSAVIEDLKNKLQSQEQEIQENTLRLKSFSETLNELKQNIRSQGSEMLEKIQGNTEKIMQMNAPKNCKEIAQAGFTESKRYFIDPDGKNFGQNPFEVFCELPEGIAKIGGKSDIEVEHCDTPGCFEKDIDYGISNQQIQALIDGSKSCSQKIDFDCFSASLKDYLTNLDLLSWVGLDGTIYSLGKLGFGNCNHKPPQWLQDSGEFNGKYVPIMKLKYGPLKYLSQIAKFSTGPLICLPPIESLTFPPNLPFEPSMNEKLNKLKLRTDRIEVVLKDHIPDSQESLSNENNPFLQCQSTPGFYWDYYSNRCTKIMKFNRISKVVPPIYNTTQNPVTFDYNAGDEEY